MKNNGITKISKLLGVGVISLFILIQLLLVFCAQKTTVVNMDGIFSYTLANNPYTYLFIDEIYEEFPKNNNWLDAHILRENYVVETYDRFNYSSVYHHQRYDVHPPLYYFAVHTICSLFPGTYSNLYTMTVNLFALFLTDLILLRLFGRLYGRAAYGAVPVMLLMSMETMFFLCTWARMYMMLFLFCAWYLCIHEKLLKRGWHRSDLVQMIFCIFFGTLTHYYFYVYAASLTVFMVCFLIVSKRKYELLNYLYSGIVGIALSWICYPWVLWHILLNEQGKHTNIEPWSLEKAREYIIFLANRLVNGRCWAIGVFLVLLCLEAFVGRKKKRKDNVLTEYRIFRKMTIGSGLLYSLIIFTLDGSNLYYPTALYITFIVWGSMILIDLAGEIPVFKKRAIYKILVSIICIIILLSPSAIKKYVSKTEDVLKWMQGKKMLMSEFRQIPMKYGNYDCIYIEEKPNGLLNNYWFEFGEYKLFKRIWLKDFNEHGITREDLKGRGSMSEGILVYAPKECIFDDKEYRWLAENEGYNIYEFIGEDVR